MLHRSLHGTIDSYDISTVNASMRQTGGEIYRVQTGRGIGVGAGTVLFTNEDDGQLMLRSKLDTFEKIRL
jgi:hypothetical protein